MKSLTPPYTISVLVLFIVIGLLPKIPLWAKILIQLIVGAAIYFLGKNYLFGLPYADDLPMSDLYGGPDEDGRFNKYSLGILGTVVGVVFSLIGSGFWALVGRFTKKEEA